MEVIKFEDIISHAAASRIERIEEESKEEDDSDNSSDNSSVESINKQKSHIPRGRPKSGRVWKQRKSKFSSIIKTRGIRRSKEKKDLLRLELKQVKQHSRALIEERKKEKEEKQFRRKENLKRQEENRLKSEIVQVITNTSKIKRMKKKQLRQVEKRDTTTFVKKF
ncbi:coiled-coil domain-containing protein 86 [Zootermopsis nevadensis]|uniref:Coiled-coil domain-containing protein 86 n=1 Tax=Zootermopsis nevadensis TaxID=136037 RepID=A0A067QKG4_ZOONE|nr:coiled-coil domain-containing protein 86 [Zootermopsis nevadensis]KDR08395.1 Coiled-coil domain-containing protein 86 [Zootermopsis nevadensis]